MENGMGLLYVHLVDPLEAQDTTTREIDIGVDLIAKVSVMSIIHIALSSCRVVNLLVTKTNLIESSSHTVTSASDT